MIEIILLVIIFILGIYFGSFFTLATYRLPKKQDITHTHSYCPNCNHKLGFWDLIPVFSFIFLRGKCRYCKKPIGIRYFLFEILTGITFVLFAISLKINIYDLEISTLIYFGIAILHISCLYIISGIEKEKNVIQKSVLIFGIIIAIAYMIYSYTLNKTNVYEYVIYLCLMVILLLIDIHSFKKRQNYNYIIQILILLLYMLIITGIYSTIYTVLLSILSIGIKNILQYSVKNKAKIVDKISRTPIAFYLCVSNIIIIICSNFITNYML